MTYEHEIMAQITEIQYHEVNEDIQCTWTPPLEYAFDAPFSSITSKPTERQHLQDRNVPDI